MVSSEFFTVNSIFSSTRLANTSQFCNLSNRIFLLSGILISASEGWIKAISIGFKVLATIAPILLAMLVYSVVYKVLPYAKIRWSDAVTGAFFAALTFECMKFGFAIFLTNTAFYKTVYGAFAIFPLALIWIYLTWWITLAGAVLVSNLPDLRSGFIRVIRY